MSISVQVISVEKINIIEQGFILLNDNGDLKSPLFMYHVYHLVKNSGSTFGIFLSFSSLFFIKIDLYQISSLSQNWRC